MPNYEHNNIFPTHICESCVINVCSLFLILLMFLIMLQTLGETVHPLK